MLLSPTAQGAWDWTSFGYPGVPATFAHGIDGDRIVGSYWDAANKSHGFAYDGTTWTTLDCPGIAEGADYYELFGISGTQVVGTYHLAEGGRFHGLLYDGTTWSTLDYPDASFTSANGIYGNRIVGLFVNYERASGFVYDGTTWTTLDFPGASKTEAWGIHGDKIVGAFLNAKGSWSGFLYDGTTWTALDYPGSSFTGASGVFGDNIVGVYCDSSNREHGFLYDGTTWTSLDFPGGITSRAHGIWGDNVVGYYNNRGAYGFNLTIPEPTCLLLLGLGSLMSMRRRQSTRC